MDNTQRFAPDASWFLFGDWQGVTRLTFPGDKAKTDSDLDRPYDREPLSLRPDGRIRFQYSVDLDPITLKKTPSIPAYAVADPLGGPPIRVEFPGITNSHPEARSLQIESAGQPPIYLGAGPKPLTFLATLFDFFDDGTVIALAHSDGRPSAGLFARDADNRLVRRWGRPLSLPKLASTGAYREAGRTWLASHDPVENRGYLWWIDDTSGEEGSWWGPSVSVPVVFGGRMFWQPDDDTLMIGEDLSRVGTPDRSVTLSGIPSAAGDSHTGPVRILRVPGRTLVLPWHNLTILDLDPVKKGKYKISRKHKAAQEPMYREAEKLLRSLRGPLLRRGITVAWTGCVRTGKRAEPQLSSQGGSDGFFYAITHAIRAGGLVRLRPFGATSLDTPGMSVDNVISRPMGADDVRAISEILVGARIAPAVGIVAWRDLYHYGRERGVQTFTPDGERAALACLNSALVPGREFDPDLQTPVSAQEMRQKLQAEDVDGRLYKIGLGKWYIERYLDEVEAGLENR